MKQENAREMRDDEVAKVCADLREALALRQKYMGEMLSMHDYANVEPIEETRDPFTPHEHAGRMFSFEMRRGIMVVWPETEARHVGQRVVGRKDTTPAAFDPPLSLSTYTRDLNRLIAITSDAAVNSFCYRRLQKLEARFKLHVMENEGRETAEQRAVPHRDFYNSRKVDTHVHLAAAMNQKHLLRFIKRKMRYHPDEVVTKSASGEDMTLEQVFDEMGLTPYDLSIDALGMHTDATTFARFDKFNLKYNPLGKSKLREIFIKTDNLLCGRYFAEITQELFDDLAFSKYQKAEYRISIYGRKKEEWNQLAAWVVDHRLYSSHNRWLIQVPRLYGMYQASRQLRTFAEMLDNLFTPLFEVSIDPTSHPKLHLLLQQVVGFDCVDDESKPEGALPKPDSPSVHPEQWTNDNPHYAYYCFYLYSNLQVLNKLRRAQGLTTFDFRPHAGEAGELNHLHAAFLTARGINHGINVRKSPSLQYLYYLTQIGLALSPLSNNALFLQLHKNPFNEFFAVGLNVSLSTDDPLMFHHTREPLMEEYTIAKQVWRLSAVDLAEVARNSVLQSSFEPNVKAFWIGANYWKGATDGNDIHRTNLPNLRCRYRDAALNEELRVVHELDETDDTNSPMLNLSTPMRLPLNLPPPPLPTVQSPSRGDRSSVHSEYDGAFPRLYEPPQASHLSKPAERQSATPADAPRTVATRAESHEILSPGERWREAGRSARELNLGGSSRRASAEHMGRRYSRDDDRHRRGSQDGRQSVADIVMQRLDAQQAMLEQAQAQAQAAEARAEAATRLNRITLAAGVVIVAAVIAISPRLR